MKEQQAKIINKSDIMKALKMKGPIGWLIATFAMTYVGLNKCNHQYHKYQDYIGHDFARKVLEDLEIKYDIKPEQLENIPKEGGFIMIANHNYGSVDGMMALDIIGHMRPDFHTMSNFILAMVPPLTPVMFSVNPFTNGLSSRNSYAGVRDAMAHVKNGGSLGVFASGAVATTQPKGQRTAWGKHVIEDCPWPKSIVKFIRQAEVPVIPVYFDGVCSKHFHIVGKIDPRLRTMNLVRELFNKKGRTVPMRIGKPISVAEIASYESNDELYGYMRNRIYALQAEFEPKKVAKSRCKKTVPEPLAPAQDPKVLKAEFEAIQDKKLFQSSTFEAYLADYDDIPAGIKELGRLREETFRAVGEGTDKSIDLDEFDKHYKHLVLWDTEKERIVGAYRLGIGPEFFEEKGIKGFYTSTLFKYKEKAEDLLPHCCELGRSFICCDYQKEALPLMLLFKGLMYSMLRTPEVRYFIGPVSISNDYPLAIKSLMVWFFENNRKLSNAEIAEPTTPFKPNFRNLRPDMLLVNKDTVEKFDMTLRTISNDEYRLPTLVKKYFRLGAEIICFNVDPDFNYSLDGLILMDLHKIPTSELQQLGKGEPSEEVRAEIMNRFGHHRA